MVLLSLLASAVAMSPEAAGAAVFERCAFTGSDAVAVASVRRAAEARCPCDGFHSHRAYVDCTLKVIRDERQAGRLGRACARMAKRIFRRSTCSFRHRKVACCTRGSGKEWKGCRIRSPKHCRQTSSGRRTPCADVAFCVDTKCGLAAMAPATCTPSVLYSPEGNRLRRFDIDTIKRPPLREDILIERASLGGRDVNGQVCALPGGSGRFIAGEDSGQPHPPPGWGIFAPDGTQVGKLTATYQTDLPGAQSNAEPFGCAFDLAGHLFTSDVGNQASGPGNGQLVMWFPPLAGFPGPPGKYPNTDEPSTNFCKIAIDIPTAGSVATDEQGRVYVTSARGLKVLRFSPPFPTAPDAAGGCGRKDALGSPLADSVNVETFISDPGNVLTPTGIARARSGNWYVASVLTGVIAEYDANGVFLRRVLEPPPGEEGLPHSTGSPQGLAVDCEGDLYYADLDLRASGGDIGPGPNGKVRWIAFDACGEPQPPQIIKEGLAFPDGLGIVPGDLESEEGAGG